MPAIRRADPTDLEQLTELRVAFFRELQPDLDLADLRTATHDYLRTALPAGQFLAWVAEEESQLVATSGLVFFQRPPSPSNLSGLEGYVMNMYTLPAWRGQGLARTLLQEMIVYARTTPAHRLWLHATSAGRPLYEELGFVATDRDMELLWESGV